MFGTIAAPTYLVGLTKDADSLHKPGPLLDSRALLLERGPLLLETGSPLLETGAATPERVLAR